MSAHVFDQQFENAFAMHVSNDLHATRRAKVLGSILNRSGFIRMADQSIATLADFERDWVESLDFEAWETNLRISKAERRKMHHDQYQQARKQFMQKWLIGLVPKTGSGGAHADAS